METPQKWLIIKIEKEGTDTIHKVFASWGSGYITDDSWKMNSGIVNVTEEGDYLLFHGYSGSIYKCHKKAYGMISYGVNVLQKIIEDAKKVDAEITILDKDTNFLELLNDE